MNVPAFLIPSATAPDPPAGVSEWTETVVQGMHAGYELHVAGVGIWLVRRPDHCNRGDYLAHIEIDVTSRVTLSDADFWPRYLFGLEAAKAHCEEWLRRHGVSLTPQDPPCPSNS